MINLIKELKQYHDAERAVEDILEHEPDTRKSDNKLFLRYYELLNPGVDFKTYFLNPKKYQGFSYKTLERARRKIQARRPELKDSTVVEYRFEQEQVYFEYGRA